MATGQLTHDDHVVNLEIIKMARQAMGGFAKRAFVPGGDPSGGGGGGAPPPGGGGAPPPGGGGMDPMAMMGGMPPPGGGGAPPPPPQGGGGGGGGHDWSHLMPLITQAVQSAMGAGGGGAGGAGGAGGMLKPKIDVNVEIMKLNKMVARIADALGVHIPAHEMVATPQDLTSMAQGQQGQQQAGAAGGGGAGAIPPIDPMQGMQPAGQPGMGGPPGGGGGEKASSYRPNGRAFDSSGLSEVGNRAAAIMATRRQRK